MFTNLMDDNYQRIPTSSCGHTHAMECMCLCHIKGTKKEHFVPCCEDCPYCHKRLPLKYFKVRDY